MNHESNQQALPPQVGAVIESCEQLRAQLSRQVIGQQEVLHQLLLALFARGHCLLVGVPGLAKTLMIRTLAQALQLEFRRIQFTPDLMPSDITGTEVIQPDAASGERLFHFRPGPVFANILLADEINRTPPKTQAALLEAMQEASVTAGGESHRGVRWIRASSCRIQRVRRAFCQVACGLCHYRYIAQSGLFQRECAWLGSLCCFVPGA